MSVLRSATLAATVAFVSSLQASSPSLPALKAMEEATIAASSPEPAHGFFLCSG